MYFRSFRNLVVIFICLLSSLIASIGAAHLIPSHEIITNETYTFRWATGGDLNDTVCAMATTPPRFQNGTADPAFWQYVSRDIEFISIDLLEKRQADCQSNSSLFVLDGNPGVIWHPESGQCLHTRLKTELVHDDHAYQNIVYDTFKVLIISDECELDNRALALFKYDKNKPQRLSFLGDVDPKTGNREEWCIRHWFSSVIQVAPTCVYYSDSPEIVAETFFHEVV